MNIAQKFYRKLTETTLKKVSFFVILGSLLRLLLWFVLYKISAFYPKFFYDNYSKKVFQIVTIPMKYLASLFKFSVGEVLLISLITFAVCGPIYCIYRCCRKKSGGRAFARFGIIVLVICLLVGGNFFCYGGINYHTTSFLEISGLKTSPTDTMQLKELCIYLGRKATEARKNLEIGEDKAVKDDRSLSNLLALSTEGFEKASLEFDCLSGNLVAPKPGMLSELMCYEQICGIFPIVYTESIVNSKTPVYDICHVACHELAHQLGFAREDEANFIGYLAAINNDDPMYIYSGYYNGFCYAMNALHSYNQTLWGEVWQDAEIDGYGISDDMRAANALWDSYREKAEVVSKVSEAVNDSYLKSNDIEDGTHSYGRVVDLLLAYYMDK